MPLAAHTHGHSFHLVRVIGLDYEQKPRCGGVKDRPYLVSAGQPFTLRRRRLCLHLRMFPLVGCHGISRLYYPRFALSRHGYVFLALFVLIRQGLFPRENPITHYAPRHADVEFVAREVNIVDACEMADHDYCRRK